MLSKAGVTLETIDLNLVQTQIYEDILTKPLFAEISNSGHIPREMGKLVNGTVVDK